MPGGEDLGFAVWWWALPAALALGAAIVTVSAWRLWHNRPGGPPRDDSLRDLRRLAHAEIAAATDDPDPRLALQRIVRAAQTFVGTADDGDADYLSAAQLTRAAISRPALAPLANLVASSQTARFAEHGDGDVATVRAAAEAVVDQWR